MSTALVVRSVGLERVEDVVEPPPDAAAVAVSAAAQQDVPLVAEGA